MRDAPESVRELADIADVREALETLAREANHYAANEDDDGRGLDSNASVLQDGLDALARLEESLSPSPRDEMVCDRCRRRHGVVWFTDSDVWNAVMRKGDRGNPDEFGFCCPECFIHLAEARGIDATGWLLTPELRDAVKPEPIAVGAEIARCYCDLCLELEAQRTQDGGAA